MRERRRAAPLHQFRVSSPHLLTSTQVQDLQHSSMNKLLIFAMMLISLPLFAKDSPFACNLSAFSAQERKRHFDELGPALRRLKTGVRELPAGYAFSFPNDSKTFGMLAEWIE